MALSRCLEQHSPPQGRLHTYQPYVFPVGYPDTALVCGTCCRPGAIWLTPAEADEYTRGERVFEGPNAFTKMRACDGGLQSLWRVAETGSAIASKTGDSLHE
jgi:hypothetical protein